MLIYKGAAISSAAIALAVEKGIDIVFFDNIGKPFARTYSCKFENAASVHRHQIKAYDNGKGISLITGIIKAKIRNMAVLLEILAKDRNNSQLKDMAEKIKTSIERLEINENIDISRQKLLGIERDAARQYFNALLGYGYVILFTEIEKAAILSWLDPYSGFLHADRPGKPSMVLDMMEEWRQPVVDRSMITLVSRKVVRQDNLTRVENGFYLERDLCYVIQ